MRLAELEPTFLMRIDDAHWKMLDKIEGADGVQFLCPLCFSNNGNRREGVHSVVCWNPSVPQTTSPIPGRWEMRGTGYGDLTLVAGSSSVLITSGCKAHFLIRDGEIHMA